MNRYLYKKPNPASRILSLNFRLFFTILAFSLLLGSCNFPGTQAGQTADLAEPNETQIFENILETAKAAQFLPTETPAAGSESIDMVESSPESSTTPLPTMTPDPNRTPPALPAAFTTDLLNKRDYPHTYEEDTCVMLRNRWAAGKAEPGTIVMVVMYHSIVKGDESAVVLDNQISSEKNKQIGADLANQGFEAIDMTQFINFMTNNDYIPPRSALLIVDDRHFAAYFEDHFYPFYQEHGWKVINGWISAAETTQQLWDENASVEAKGYVDHQAHGVVHNVNMNDSSSDEYLYSELQGSIDKIQEHFGKTPKAIIWPGGNFGYRPIEIAKELGYQVGFTVNPRGPVMYNWVPLDDESDPARPSYLQDGTYDPLFVLPRYWDTDVSQHIDTVRQIGKSAHDELFANRAIELEYYDIVCKPTLGDLSETP